jgi:hypothetical protein
MKVRINPGAILLTIAAALIFLGCDNLNGGGGAPADKTALNNAISAANAAKEGVEVDTDGTHIPAEKVWVTQEVMDSFNNAISAAQAAANDAGASQGDVDSAAGALTTATTVFNNSKKNGTLRPIDTAIKMAKDAKEGVEVDPVIDGDTVPGTVWVSASALAALDAAISAAEAAAGNTGASESELNVVLNALNAALETFTAAKQIVPQPDKTNLNAVIESALAAMAGVEINDNAANVPMDSFYVTQTEWDALAGPLAAAQAASGSAAATANQVSAAESALSPAIAPFTAAKKTGTNSVRIEYYVNPAAGNDSNAGSAASPLKTVKAALSRISTAYSGPGWPQSGSDPRAAGITITGEVTWTTEAPSSSVNLVWISGTYPPITLKGTGTLNAQGTAAAPRRVLCIGWNQKVILEGTLTFTGGYRTEPDGTGGGVLVQDSSAFTMNGGEISGNTAGHGGGVFVRTGSVFTMNNGRISGNTTIPDDNGNDGSGGGVGLNSATFFMNGGEISGNTTGGGGGGIELYHSTLIMNGGKISNNSANGGGGVGVYGEYIASTFTMNGGEISGNTASWVGGVALDFNADIFVSTFTKTGGIIYGDTDNVHSPGSKENTSTGYNNHAVQVEDYGGNPVRWYRSATAFETDNISSTTGKGLSESGNPPYKQ